MLDLLRYLTQRSNKPCDPSSYLSGRGATKGCWYTGSQTDEVGEIECDLTGGLLIEIIIVKEDPGACGIACSQEADRCLLYAGVLKIDEESDSDLAVRRIDVLARLPFHVSARLALRDLEDQRW